MTTNAKRDYLLPRSGDLLPYHSRERIDSPQLIEKMTGPIWNTSKTSPSTLSRSCNPEQRKNVPHECDSYQGGQQNEAERNPIKIRAYKVTVLQRMWLLLLCLVTCGLILMLFYWRKDLLKKFRILTETHLLDQTLSSAR